MKQYITVEQYHELSEEERHRFIEWTSTHSINQMAMRSIGHLIWFLDENEATYNRWYDGGFISKNATGWHVDMERVYHHESPELVDALWETVKFILRDEKEEE